MKNPDISNILEHYPIHPLRITRFGKTGKIEAEEGLFALKETQVPRKQIEECFQTIRFFEKQHLPAVTPVLPAADGGSCVEKNGYLYYLMPWGKSSQGYSEADFFKTLALFHRADKTKVPLDRQTCSVQGELKNRNAEKALLDLEVYADNIERKRYFSPFELSVLSYFPLMYECFRLSSSWFEEWERAVLDSLEMKEVQCHGNPTPEHIITDPGGRLRFINLEQTARGHPVHDIARMYSSCMRQRLWEQVQGGSWIKVYDNHFPLSAEEKALLKSRLLYPASLFSFINKGRVRPAHAEPEWTLRLEEEGRLLEKMKQDVAAWPDKEGAS